MSAFTIFFLFTAICALGHSCMFEGQLWCYECGTTEYADACSSTNVNNAIDCTHCIKTVVSGTIKKECGKTEKIDLGNQQPYMEYYDGAETGGQCRDINFAQTGSYPANFVGTYCNCRTSLCNAAVPLKTATGFILSALLLIALF